jgi:hypothetical protein
MAIDTELDVHLAARGINAAFTQAGVMNAADAYSQGAGSRR